MRQSAIRVVRQTACLRIKERDKQNRECAIFVGTLSFFLLCFALQRELYLAADPMLRLHNTADVHIARIGNIASVHLYAQIIIRPIESHIQQENRFITLRRARHGGILPFPLLKTGTPCGSEPFVDLVLQMECQFMPEIV